MTSACVGVTQELLLPADWDTSSIQGILLQCCIATQYLTALCMTGFFVVQMDRVDVQALEVCGC